MRPSVKAIFYGLFANSILLALYFAVLTLVSGWNFAASQFSDFWYFIVSLSAGFGIQAGLYAYLRKLVLEGNGAGKALGVTGTTSTAAMISCCAHYLANLLPILGVTGIVTFAGQYQIQLFWVGLAFNLAGIFYIGQRVLKIKKA
jgi:Cu+-exporting ATPase